MCPYEPASKCQSMVWKHTSLPRTKKFRSVLSAGKVILMLFWHFNVPILEHSQDHGQIVNSAWYYAVLEDESKPAICIKHRGMLTQLFYIMTMLNLI
jgi:hypothetical protein